MVIIGVVGLPSCGKHEFMTFLSGLHQLRLFLLEPPSLFSECFSQKPPQINEETKENCHLNMKTIKSEAEINEISEIWGENVIIGPLYSLETVKMLKKKPYFHLVFIDCTVLRRFENFQRKHNNNIEISAFLKLEEELSKKLQLEEIRKLSKFEVRNAMTIEIFREEIEKNIRYIIRPIKPTWDQYFMNIAFSVRTRSNCMRKNAGAILVRNNRILSTGYTGTPQGLVNCNEGGCECCNNNRENLVYCLCIHAEENCILEVGIAGSEGAICYCTQFPCIWCMKVLVQGKIRRLVYFREEPDIEEPLALAILKENNIEYFRYEKDYNVF